MRLPEEVGLSDCDIADQVVEQRRLGVEVGEIDLRLGKLGPAHGPTEPGLEGRTARLAEDQPGAPAHQLPSRLHELP